MSRSKNDIITRLRNWGAYQYNPRNFQLAQDAIRAIEELRSERDELKFRLASTRRHNWNTEGPGDV